MAWMPSQPAAPEVVSRLESGAPFKLPAAYLSFLRQVGGGEGDLRVDPGWIQFWPAESVMQLNREYEVSRCIPGFFGFGSNGGGELFAFDMRGGGEPVVVVVPFIPMEATEAEPVAEHFNELVAYLDSEPSSGAPSVPT